MRKAINVYFHLNSNFNFSTNAEPKLSCDSNSALRDTEAGAVAQNEQCKMLSTVLALFAVYIAKEKTCMCQTKQYRELNLQTDCLFDKRFFIDFYKLLFQKKTNEGS